MTNSGGNESLEYRNAMALAANLDDLRAKYDERLKQLENEILTVKSLVQKQNQVLGDIIQRMMGHGSTVLEDGG